jgi:potassium-transporting ATPase KdpC subunit
MPRRELTSALLAVAALTIVCGIAYPVIVWGIGRVAFPGRADGSQLRLHGRVVGSRLLGQDFSEAIRGPGGETLVNSAGEPVTRPDLRYFQERPSADKYNPAATAFSNRGPNQASAVAFYREQLAAFLARERPYNPGLEPSHVPIDAVTTSASGVDPQISLANARLQARRVAAVRRLPLRRVLALVSTHTEGRFLGVFGEPGVNVLELNIALDRQGER